MSRMTAEQLVAERRNLESVIYDELRARIISLRYRPGSMIFETEVAAEFGVSRTPVSRAFLRLASENLLQVLPQRGARVSFLSRVKVLEAQVVRESLEVTAFVEVAHRWDDHAPRYQEVLRDLRTVIDRQRDAVSQRDSMLFTRLDEDYHDTIIALSGNMTLLGVVNDMRAVLNRVRYVELQEAHHELPAIVHHEEILAAIRRNDPSETADRLRAHLRMLESFWETLFEKRKDIFI